MWKKHGLVFNVDKYKNERWHFDSALTPQPFDYDQNTIRVYAGFRDRNGVSRIGFVDLDKSEPTKIKGVSTDPVLDIGRDGCFDDNGVILGDVVRAGSEVYMFFVGFQLVAKAKFIALTGVAVSYDNGNTFKRISEAPLLGRWENQNSIAAIHTAMFEGGLWKIWFAQGDGWEVINGTPYPKYHINYVETNNLKNIPRESILAIPAINPVYRIGRPKVYKTVSGRYMLIATAGTTSGDYTPRWYFSDDGITGWKEECGYSILPSSCGWDSETLCYPALINNNDSTLMIYNGNSMGVNGFGLAVLDHKII